MSGDGASATVVLADYVGRPSADMYAGYAAEFGLRLIAPDGEGEERLDALLPQADYLMVRRRSVGADIVARAPRLRAVINVGQRPRFSVNDFANQGVEVVLLPRLTAMAVADLVLCMMLSVSRSVVTGHRDVLDGAYRDRGGLQPAITSETQFAFNWLDLPGDAPLYGRVLGLVGFGEIGALVARRAQAFGMSVLYFQRNRLGDDEAAALRVEYARLEDLLARSDFVSLHVPDVAATRCLIDAGAIARMRSSAYLINASRGRVVDENALVHALRERRLAGAALDVFQHEPLPAESPLLDLPNVCLTPHLGGGNAQTLMREMKDAFARISKLHEHRPRQNAELSDFEE